MDETLILPLLFHKSTRKKTALDSRGSMDSRNSMGSSMGSIEQAPGNKYKQKGRTTLHKNRNQHKVAGNRCMAVV